MQQNDIKDLKEKNPLLIDVQAVMAGHKQRSIESESKKVLEKVKPLESNLSSYDMLNPDAKKKKCDQLLSAREDI